MKPDSRESDEHNRNDTYSSGRTTDVKGDRVRVFVHGVALVLRHHGAPYDVVESVRRQLFDYLEVPHEGTFLKRAKYTILWPLAYFLGNEPPAEPDLPFRFHGKAWRWMRQRFNCKSRRNIHLWYSFLQSKRAGAPVTPDIVLENFQKHRDQMQMPDPLRDEGELFDEVMDNLSAVIDRIVYRSRHELRRVFQRPELAVHKASEHASFEVSRKGGGQAGLLRDLLGIKSALREPESLGRMTVYDELTYKGGRVLGGLATISVVRPGELDDLQDLLRERVYSYEKAIPRLNAQVEAVLEPFKVRTISKGQGLEYYLAKPVQKIFHSCMREMEPFSLIGRPFDPTDLMDVYAAQKRFGEPEKEFWLSIDYSAATDGLSASLSQEILYSLLNEVSTGAFAETGSKSILHLLLGVLAPHRIFYPEVAGVQLEPVDQQNGQLMGSILSFPILCLANLGLYLTVRKRLRPKASLKDLLSAVRINGDDMLYIGTQAEWELHKELGRMVGLEMSPGKAYIHSRYANINSVSVVMDLREANPTPEIIPFLNVGLMVGNHKVLGRVGGDSEEIQTHPYISVINEVVRGAWKGKQPDVFKQYIAMHRHEIRAEARGRNLFLPISLGGFGVTTMRGIDVALTRRQVELAERLVRTNRFLVPLEMPMPPGVMVRELLDVHVDPVHLQPESARKTELYLVGKRSRFQGPIWGKLFDFPWGLYRRVEV